jgi:hypothetical protein
MFLSGMDDNPDLDLEEMVARIFDNYPSEFREYWGLDSREAPEGLDVDEWLRYKELDLLARKVASLGSSLARPGKLKEQDLRAPIRMRNEAYEARKTLSELHRLVAEQHPEDPKLREALRNLRIEEDVEYRFLLASLQLYLADHLVSPADLASRVVSLTQFACRVKSPRATKYLSRVSRCYIYGMIAEMALMTRATLEAVLHDRIPEEQVRAIQGVASNRRVGLGDYIAAASRTILDDQAGKAATLIKRAGDDAIHVDYELTADPETILEALVAVLTSIEKQEKM